MKLDEYKYEVAIRKEQKIQLVEEFYKEYGRLPKCREKYKNIAIGAFLNNIKKNCFPITEKQMKRLLAIGFTLEKKDKEEEKEQAIKLVEEFYREMERLPYQRETYKGWAIGKFLNSLNQGNTKITEEQMERLMKLGFEGQRNDVTIERKIRKIEQFYQETGTLPEAGEHLGREKERSGDILLSIRTGKVRITEKQFLRLQRIDATLTREQVQFFEKPKINTKCGGKI